MKFLFLLQIGFIFLGGWWAYQEGTWGGWWNWDASENLSLFPLISYFYLIHRSNYFNFLTLQRNLELIFLYFFFFLVLQLTYLTSAHSFGIEFIYIFSKNTPLLVSLNFLLNSLLINVLSFKRYNFLNFNAKFTNYLPSIPIFIVIVIVITFFILLKSFFLSYSIHFPLLQFLESQWLSFLQITILLIFLNWNYFTSEMGLFLLPLLVFLFYKWILFSLPIIPLLAIIRRIHFFLFFFIFGSSQLIMTSSLTRNVLQLNGNERNFNIFLKYLKNGTAEIFDLTLQLDSSFLVFLSFDTPSLILITFSLVILVSLMFKKFLHVF